MTALRAYQALGIEAIFAELRSGKRRVLVVAPTGAGKTIVIAEIVRKHRAHPRGGRALVVVHRAELVEQTRAKLLTAGLERVGIVAAGRDEDHGAPVLVASVQTLLARDVWPDGITLLIPDEAHHYRAEEWRRVPDHYVGAFVIGFTATPMRSDGSPLGDLFDALVVVAQVPELIELGHLCPIDVVAPPRETDGLCEIPITAWRQNGRGRPTVIFCSTVDAAQELAEEITAEGANAAAIWGDMRDDDRESALAGFASGAIATLTNVFVLTEGWDCPRAEVCILARGCDHVGTYLQMVGRVLRPYPGKAGALLVDLRGVVHRHGYPDEIRQYSLNGRAISGAGPTKDCPECALEWPLSQRLCDPEHDEQEGCGYVFPRRGPALDLAPLRRMTPEERERKAFEHALQLARSRGWSDGYAIHRFAERFGRKPWGLWREFGCKSRGAA
jgi:superfamily II DNA or RNA helicase